MEEKEKGGEQVCIIVGIIRGKNLIANRNALN